MLEIECLARVKRWKLNPLPTPPMMKLQTITGSWCRSVLNDPSILETIYFQLTREPNEILVRCILEKRIDAQRACI